MDEEERTEMIRYKVRQIIARRQALRIGAVALIILSLIFFARGTYAVALLLALGAVALTVLSDWIVKPPEEL